MTTGAAQAIYVHVPYCHTICGYCDFYSQVLDKGQTSVLVDTLLLELDRRSAATALDIRSIFVGGGTPTTLPADQLGRLLRGVRAVARSALVEFSVEANPATVTPAVAATLAQSGVNRVSIGAQSFDTSELRVLERIHRPEQVGATVQACRNEGISQVNLDLIFAVPGQSLEAWRRNLDAALELGPDHLSCYGLTYEAGTPLFDQLQRGEVRRVDPDLEAAMYEFTIARLAEAGFEHYEISNFAKPGRRCRHNLVYWRNEPFLAVGPSASGYLHGERYRNVPDTAAYIRGMQAGAAPEVTRERLEPERTARETMMLGLRLIEGVNCADFAARFGEDPRERYREVIGRHEALGLLTTADGCIRLTARGLLVGDSVMADFL